MHDTYCIAPDADFNNECLFRDALTHLKIKALTLILYGQTIAKYGKGIKALCDKGLIHSLIYFPKFSNSTF